MQVKTSFTSSGKVQFEKINHLFFCWLNLFAQIIKAKNEKTVTNILSIALELLQGLFFEDDLFGSIEGNDGKVLSS